MKKLLFILACIGLIAFFAIRYVSTTPTTSPSSSPSSSTGGGGGFTSSSGRGGGSAPSAQTSPSPFAKAQQSISIPNQIPPPQITIAPVVSPVLPKPQINTSQFSQSLPYVSQLPPSPILSPKPLPSTNSNFVPSVTPPESLAIQASPPPKRPQLPTQKFSQSPLDFLSYLINLWLLQLFEKVGLLSVNSLT